MTRLQDKDMKFCSSCAKPLASEYNTITSKLNGKQKWHYHNTIEECANAPAIRKDWRRSGQEQRTPTHNRVEAGLQASDGYSWDTDDSVSMR